MTLARFSFKNLGGSLARNIGRFAVTRLVFQSYSWGNTEQRKIEQMLNQIRADSYRNMLSEMAANVGCGASVGRVQFPRGSSQNELQGLSRTEARGIVDTYNDDLRREIARLFEDNPTGRRNYYRSGISEWHGARQTWKGPQVSLQTVQTARTLAQQDFSNNNAELLGEKRYRFTGPPPREEECAELMAMGVVSEDVVLANPIPIHIGCPHEWTLMPTGQVVDCARLWVG